MSPSTMNYYCFYELNISYLINVIITKLSQPEKFLGCLKYLKKPGFPVSWSVYVQLLCPSPLSHTTQLDLLFCRVQWVQGHWDKTLRFMCYLKVFSVTFLDSMSTPNSSSVLSIEKDKLLSSELIFIYKLDLT